MIAYTPLFLKNIAINTAIVNNAIFFFELKNALVSVHISVIPIVTSNIIKANGISLYIVIV